MSVHGVTKWFDMSNGDYLGAHRATICTHTRINDEEVYVLKYTEVSEDITCPDCILTILGELP